jgi:UDP-N-acetylmuramate dehydrogenase
MAAPEPAFREQVLLAPYTTFGIGGPARWFAEVNSEGDLLTAVTFARERHLPIFVLGGGSNVLIADEGFPGVVIHIAMQGIDEIPSADPATRRFAVAAGENWDNFVSFAVARNLGGIECLAGIPGTVGGTPIQNVGAYGQEVATTITGVRVLDVESLQWKKLSAGQCGFSYRQSIFNTAQRNRYIVTQVYFDLKTDAQPTLRYRDLQHYFKNRLAPGLAETAAAVREIRHAKGMLLVPGEADCRSAGSFFKNPTVPFDKLNEIAALLSFDVETIPKFPAGSDTVKLPAAWLLEQAGFHRGYALGSAALSMRHTLAITNTGNARAADILALGNQIISKVEDRFGILLEREPLLIGS